MSSDYGIELNDENFQESKWQILTAQPLTGSVGLSIKRYPDVQEFKAIVTPMNTRNITKDETRPPIRYGTSESGNPAVFIRPPGYPPATWRINDTDRTEIDRLEDEYNEGQEFIQELIKDKDVGQYIVSGMKDIDPTILKAFSGTMVPDLSWVAGFSEAAAVHNYMKNLPDSYVSATMSRYINHHRSSVTVLCPVSENNVSMHNVTANWRHEIPSIQMPLSFMNDGVCDILFAKYYIISDSINTTHYAIPLEFLLDSDGNNLIDNSLSKATSINSSYTSVYIKFNKLSAFKPFTFTAFATVDGHSIGSYHMDQSKSSIPIIEYKELRMSPDDLAEYIYDRKVATNTALVDMALDSHNDAIIDAYIDRSKLEGNPTYRYKNYPDSIRYTNKDSASKIDNGVYSTYDLVGMVKEYADILGAIREYNSSRVVGGNDGIWESRIIMNLVAKFMHYIAASYNVPSKSEFTKMVGSYVEAYSLGHTEGGSSSNKWSNGSRHHTTFDPKLAINEVVHGRLRYAVRNTMKQTMVAASNNDFIDLKDIRNAKPYDVRIVGMLSLFGMKSIEYGINNAKMRPLIDAYSSFAVLNPTEPTVYPIEYDKYNYPYISTKYGYDTGDCRWWTNYGNNTYPDVDNIRVGAWLTRRYDKKGNYYNTNNNPQTDYYEGELHYREFSSINRYPAMTFGEDYYGVDPSYYDIKTDNMVQLFARLFNKFVESKYGKATYMYIILGR